MHICLKSAAFSFHIGFKHHAFPDQYRVAFLTWFYLVVDRGLVEPVKATFCYPETLYLHVLCICSVCKLIHCSLFFVKEKLCSLLQYAAAYTPL